MEWWFTFLDVCPLCAVTTIVSLNRSLLLNVTPVPAVAPRVYFYRTARCWHWLMTHMKSDPTLLSHIRYRSRFRITHKCGWNPTLVCRHLWATQSSVEPLGTGRAQGGACLCLMVAPKVPIHTDVGPFPSFTPRNLSRWRAQRFWCGQLQWHHVGVWSGIKPPTFWFVDACSTSCTTQQRLYQKASFTVY